MSRSAMDLEQELMAMWHLVNELSDQLQTNRELAESLQAQAKDVKGQAVHSGTGFPLRRFNIDISDEQFTSELEKFASHLVLENQSLQHENKQLNLLLKEYEQTLEGVMAKFRSVSYAATQHELTLHQYYTSLLHEIQTTHSTATLLDSNALSTLLTRLSTLLRAALRNANGEDEDLPAGLEDILGLAGAGSGSGSPASVRSPGHLLAGNPGSGSSSLRLPTSTSRRTDRAWLGDLVPSGGYSGTDGRPDWALEREVEVCRLAEENRMLREMLAIEGDIEAEFARRAAGGAADGAAAENSEGSSPSGAQSRPASSSSAVRVASPSLSANSSTAQPTSVAMQASTSSPPSLHEAVHASSSATSTSFADLISSLASADPTGSTLQGQPVPSASTSSTGLAAPGSATGLVPPGAQPAEMVRSISSPSSAGSAPSSSSSVLPITAAQPSEGSRSSPTSPPGSRTRSPIRRDRAPHPPAALSPPVVKASIPLPTLGHASGTSSSGSSAARPTSPTPGQSPSAPLSSLFLKTAGAATSAVKSGATTAVSVGEAEEMGGSAGAGPAGGTTAGASAGDAGLGLGLGGPTTASIGASESKTKPTELVAGKDKPDGKAGKTTVTAEAEPAPAVAGPGGEDDGENALPQQDNRAKDMAPAEDEVAAQSPSDHTADKPAERTSKESTAAPLSQTDKEVAQDTPSDASVDKTNVEQPGQSA